MASSWETNLPIPESQGLLQNNSSFKTKNTKTSWLYLGAEILGRGNVSDSQHTLVRDLQVITENFKNDTKDTQQTGNLLKNWFSINIFFHTQTPH